MAKMNILNFYNQYGYALKNSPKRKRSESIETRPPTPKKMKTDDEVLSIIELDEQIEQFEYEVYGKNNGDFMKNLCGECKVDMGMDEYSQLCGGHYCMA
jgi:hypothetical protein